MRLAPRDPGGAFVRRQRAAGAGIERAIGAVRGVQAGGQLAGNVAARAKAGIDDAQRFQPRQCGVIGRQPRRLDQQPVPADAEPAQVIVNALGERRPAAGDVGILDPQQEGAAAFPRQIMGEQGGVTMADMQPPGRAGRKARHQMLWSLHLTHTSS